MRDSGHPPLGKRDLFSAEMLRSVDSSFVTYVFVPSSRVKRSEEDLTAGPLNLGPKVCPETSAITICVL
jgi:hypothetical protein